MDAKDLRIESALGAHTNDGSTKYAPSTSALQNNGHKPYDTSANPLAKADVPTSRPCAIIGPDRVVPPQTTSDVYSKKIPTEPWPCTDILYQPPPEYPHNPADYPPPRNISPRQTFQENMQRIMVPPTYVSVKNGEERNLKFSKSMPPEAKYCDVPFTISPLNSEPKNVKNSEGFVPNNNLAYSQPVPPQNWPNTSINVRPLKPYGATELYQYSEYSHYPGPRPISMIRPHRNIHEDVNQYQDRLYQEANIRFKPYPSPKERPLQPPHHPQARYDYIANYPNTFHLHNPYTGHKYDVPKSIPPQPGPVYPPVSLKYLDRRFPISNTERYQRSPNQQVNFNPHFCNQTIPPAYGPVPGNCLQNRPYPVSQDPSAKPIMQNRLYFDSNNVRKYYPSPENVYINEINRPQTMKNDVLYPSYPPMHPLSPHHVYRKDSLKGYEHYRNFEYPTNVNALSRLPLQFSPKTISISPDSNTSIDTTQALNMQEDCGYVSQSSTASARSIESGVNRISSDLCHRPETRFEVPYLNKSGQGKNATSSKDKKGLDVRQFLQMWNEGDDEGHENNKESSIPKNATTNNNISHVESTNNQEQLYVLGLVNVPNEELGKYDHIQKISKLPENIKGYNNIELLNQYEKLVESPNIKFSLTPPPQKQKNYHGIRNASARQGMEMPPRPISPLDVEAKISQSVIHKEVGCNFEIRPCSPQMLNVEIAAPVHKVVGERLIEKVVNPAIPKSPVVLRVEEPNNISSSRISPKVPSCNMILNQYPSPGLNDSLKTNYCLQDLESNSGVCLASLPRLDNDIELNFPEINQQFIDANKIESSCISSLQDLPVLDTENITNIQKSGNNTLTKSFISEHNQCTEPDKEVSKLSKYRKHKKTDSTVNDSDVNKNQNLALHRTNSVIIKNPDNTKGQEDYSSVPIMDNKYVSNNMIDYTSSNNINTNFNRTVNEKSNQSPMSMNDTAIDFSINKNIEQTNRNNCVNNLGGLLINNVHIENNVIEDTTNDKHFKINSPAQGNAAQEKKSASDAFSISKPNSSPLDNFSSPNIDENRNEEKCTGNLTSNTLLVDKIDFASNNEDNSTLQNSVIIHSNLRETVTETSSASIFSPEGILQQQNILIANKDAISLVDCINPTNHNNSPLSEIDSHEPKDSLLEQPIPNKHSLEIIATVEELPVENSPFLFNDDKQAEKFEIFPKHNETPPSTQTDTAENLSSKNNIKDDSNYIFNPYKSSCEIESHEQKDSLLEQPIPNKPSLEIIETVVELPGENSAFLFNDDKQAEKFEIFSKHNETLPSTQSDTAKNLSSKNTIKDDSNYILNPYESSSSIATLVAKEKKESNSIKNMHDDKQTEKNESFPKHNETLSSTQSDATENQSSKNNMIDELNYTLDSYESSSSIATLVDKEKKESNSMTNIHNDELKEKIESFSKHNETPSSIQSDTTENRSSLKSVIDDSNYVLHSYESSGSIATLVTKEIKKSNSVKRHIESEGLENEIKNQANTKLYLPSEVNSKSLSGAEINMCDCDHKIQNTTNKSKEIQHVNDLEATEKNRSNLKIVENEILIKGQSEEKESIDLESEVNTEFISKCSDKLLNFSDTYDINVIEISETGQKDKALNEESNNNNHDTPKELELIPESALNFATSSSQVNIEYNLDHKANDQDHSGEDKDNPESKLSCTSKNEATVVADYIVKSYHKRDFACKKELFSPLFQNLLLYNDGVVTSYQNKNVKDHYSCNRTNCFDTENVNVNIPIRNILDCDSKNAVNPVTLLKTDKNGPKSKENICGTKQPPDNEITDQGEESLCVQNFFDQNNDNQVEINTAELKNMLNSENSYINNNFNEPLQQSVIEPIGEIETAVDSTNYKNNDDLIDNQLFATHRKLFPSKRTLKRSLSESAVTEYTNVTDSAKDNYENYIFANKRSKINDSDILVESHMIAENITNFIQNNRRNSISTIYNDESVSFCIVIDNDCVLTEENEDCQKICYTEVTDNCSPEMYTESEAIISESGEEKICEHSEQCEYDNEETETFNSESTEEKNCENSKQCEYTMQDNEFIIHNNFENRTIEETWVEDVACMETVYSDDVAEDIVISAPLSPKSAEVTEDENDSNDFSFNVNENEHRDKVKYIYGNQMCDDDALLVEKLYRTPQMDVNKTLIDRESRSSGEYNRYYDNEALEKILSESYISETQSLILNNTETFSEAIQDEAQAHRANIELYEKNEICKDIGYSKLKLVDQTSPKIDETNISCQEPCEMPINGYVNTCESSCESWIPNEKEDKLSYTISSSPEVSSTTSEEKSSAILLKIRSYKGTKISEISKMSSSFNYSQSQSCENTNYSLSTSRPLITKAAQKYIPPLKETISDLKVKLRLPKQSLYKLQQLKKSKEEPKINTIHNKNFIKKLPCEYTKKVKPKFEDVLKSIDEIQFKKHKEKNRKSKQSIPKVIIKKNENGAHYASTQRKETFNPDLTGRKWQPWVFLEKNSFIDKMALKQKFKAIYNHRKKTYVLAESFRKYKSYSNSKFEITHPKLCDGVSTGKLKYTIRLKHI